VRFLFVGEKPSPTAYRRGWNWQSGQLAGKTLADALREGVGVDVRDCRFFNIFGDDPDAPESGDNSRRVTILLAMVDDHVVVALGSKVARVLERYRIHHARLIHPAARGKIRNREAYINHVRAVLGPFREAIDA